MTAPDRADPGRGPRLPAAERRRQLLDVALEAFAANGFHVTSMDDIAEAAGVTKPVLYQHFRSKRALYLELLDDVGARLMEAITKATATPPKVAGIAQAHHVATAVRTVAEGEHAAGAGGFRFESARFRPGLSRQADATERTIFLRQQWSRQQRNGGR